MTTQRSEANPILKPKRNHLWESMAVFNGCPIKRGQETIMLYRAMSRPYYNVLTNATLSVSSIGLARSNDGVNFSGRRRFIYPEYTWERYGCEDPRVTKFSDCYYIFYTAISTWPPSAEGIKVGLAISRDLRKVTRKHLITPFNAKAMALFPKMINNKIYAILTVNTDKPPAKICLVEFNRKEDILSQGYWQEWYNHLDKHALTIPVRPQDHFEVGAPPIKTKDGLILLYSYITNYFDSSKENGFEIRAVLLDHDNPFKIIGKTEYPLMIPEEYYEKFGFVPNVVFPSGAIVSRQRLHIYYGAADTTCCTASIPLPTVLGTLMKRVPILKLKRANQNPIIKPLPDHAWENKATFNPAALYLRGKVHILYRAMSNDNTSTFGYATSTDGININYRAHEPVYVPRGEFEGKGVPGGNSGCEDPRLTKIGNRIFLFYTAFNGTSPPRVAVSYISVRNFLTQQWDWSKPSLITPPQFDNKDAFLFPEIVNGKYIFVHRLGDCMDYDFSTDIDKKLNSNVWLDEHSWIQPRKGWWDSEKTGAAAPPVKTRKGWIMLYHGVSDDRIYRVGAVLLDLKNPLKILSRLDHPLFEPEAPYEIKGQVNQVVFPCGNVIIGDDLYVYYGGGDSVVGVATANVNELLTILDMHRI